MAKFKKGDRVRCVKRDNNGEKIFRVGETVVVYESWSSTFYDEDGNLLWTDQWELATPSPIPDTVTIGGVEYVRKPEPEHVWAWGQWARVSSDSEDYDGKVCFVLGPLGKCGWVPVSFIGALGKRNTDGLHPSDLTYLGTAIIPE